MQYRVDDLGNRTEQCIFRNPGGHGSTTIQLSKKITNRILYPRGCTGSAPPVRQDLDRLRQNRERLRAARRQRGTHVCQCARKRLVLKTIQLPEEIRRTQFVLPFQIRQNVAASQQVTHRGIGPIGHKVHIQRQDIHQWVLGYRMFSRIKRGHTIRGKQFHDTGRHFPIRHTDADISRPHVLLLGCDRVHHPPRLIGWCCRQNQVAIGLRNINRHLAPE